MKRIISAILICCLILPFLPASAAEEAVAQSSIEEILNEYHEKAFEAQYAEANGGASTYARGGSGQTLEQETVDELTEAGYEAYNVTGENYEELEAALDTDFASLGLDSGSSYVIVISGEDPAAQANSNARAIDPPSQENFGGDGGGDGDGHTYVDYVYKGEKYCLRYITVSSTGADTLIKSSVYAPQEPDRVAYFLANLFSTVLVGTADSITEKVPFGTLASLLYSSPDDHIYTEIVPSSFAIHATSVWTCIYIQVWDKTANCWTTAQLTEYVTSMAYCAGSTYNSVTGKLEPHVSDAKYITTYSRLYFNEEQRKQEALIAYSEGRVSPSTVDRVDFYILTKDGEILFVSEGNPLFAHILYVHPIYPNSYVD